MMWYGFGHGFMGWGGGMFMVLFWVLVIGLIIWVVSRGGAPALDTCRCTGDSNALNILRERYAKGEIGKEEFEQMKKSLA